MKHYPRILVRLVRFVGYLCLVAGGAGLGGGPGWAFTLLMSLLGANIIAATFEETNK